MYVTAPYVCRAWGGQKRVSPGAGVRDECKKPCWCWECSPGPPHEHQVLLIAEPSLQPALEILWKGLNKTHHGLCFMDKEQL